MRRHRTLVWAAWAAAAWLGVMGMALPAHADEPEPPARSRRLEEVVVTGEQPTRPFLPDVSQTQIYAGKKTAVIDLRTRPAIANNNYRQALAQTPGLVLSEETTPLVSIGYRGLAPDRMQFMQVLKDGVPIQADLFGYPEAYYTPPFQTVERIEFVHGGASLMYGPQPGGALNFITKSPQPGTPFAAYSEHLFGDNQMMSHTTRLTGLLDPLGYQGYLHEREGNGFRETNSDFEVLGGGARVTLGQTTDSRLTLEYDEYHEEHGEPGGLTRAEADGEGRDITHRFSDRFRLERYAGVLRYERDLDEDNAFALRAFGGHYRRYSKRQRGGGFGTTPTGATNEIQEQDFYTFGLEPRFRHSYDAFGQEGHALTVGAMTYFSDSPREDQRGSTPEADSGSLRNHSDRQMQYFSLFAEHLFRFGKLSLTPGVRMEHLWQQVKEQVNVDKTAAGTPLADESAFDAVPLFGLGVAYDLTPRVTLYSNLSQGYRPKAFTQAVPTGATQVVNGDLDEGKSFAFDVGMRGRYEDLLSWDASYFVMRFDDQIGTAGNTIANVGHALHHGLEVSADADVVGWADARAGTDHRNQWGSLKPFINLLLLDAEFIKGPQDGKRPQYAPQYTLRSGLQYDWRRRVTANLSSVLGDDHFGDDANTAAQRIPSYKVWDLAGEVKLYQDYVSLIAGINNLFDERYFSRATSGGLDPASERNLYAGLRVGVTF